MKKTLQMEDATARKMYPGASAEIKSLLESSFGKDFFNQKITDRIKTFEDVLNEIKLNPNVAILLSYNGQDKDMLAAQAHLKLTFIARVLNEDWTPDWTNSNQPKFYPWMDMSSGLGLSYCDYVYTFSITYVGSRLVFKTRELAEYAAKQFTEIYKDLMVL